MSKIAFRALIPLAFLIVFLVGCGPIVLIQLDEIGVVTDLRTGKLDNPIGPGVHLMNPLIQQVTIYPTGQLEYAMSNSLVYGQTLENPDAIVALTQDSQQVRVSVSVLYRLDQQRINMIHMHWRDRYADEFIRPTLRSLVREITATYGAHDLLSTGRVSLEEELQSRLETAFDPESLILDEVSIRDLQFTPEFTATVEAEEIATMTAEAPLTQTPATPFP